MFFITCSYRRSSYVSRGERCYDSDDSGMSDFIVDDDDGSAESSLESDCSECNKKDSGICSTGNDQKGYKKKRVEESSSENGNDDDDDDVPLSSLIKKKKSQRSLSQTITATNGGDSDESFTTTKSKTGNKRRKVIQCSDSDEDTGQCISQPQRNGVNENSENSDGSDSLHGTKQSKLYEASAPLRPRSRRVRNLTQQTEDKHRRMFGTLLKKRQTAKLDPKERLERKQLSGSDGDKTSSSSLSSSEGECDPLQEAEAIFMHSSELEEDDDDRDFIDDDEQSSDDGLNCDGASQFLKLLDTFTGKPKDEDVNGLKTVSFDTENTRLKRMQQRRKKRKERKMSKWRRIKMEDDSEESDTINTVTDTSGRHPPLHLAVLENDFESVSKLLKEDPDCVYELGYRKRTALHLAALEDRVDLVKLLLENGGDRTALDCYYLPAIAYAADGHPDCVQLLLDHMNVKNVSRSMRNNPQGMNLLHFAVGEKRDGLECDDRARCLELLFSQDKQVCSKLLEERDARTFTPLVAAVYAGQYKVRNN